MRKPLTDEQAWKDLQEVSHTRRSSGPVIAMCAALCLSVLLVCTPAIILGIILLVVTICMFPKICKAPKVPAWDPNDPDALIYGTDVCIDRKRKYDSEACETYYEAVYEKAGHIWDAGMFSAGYPNGNDTQIGDRFYTVSLRDNPKAIQYYSMKEWYLEERVAN